MIISDQIRNQPVITDWMRRITVISSHLLKLDLLRNSLCDGSLRALLAPHRWNCPKSRLKVLHLQPWTFRVKRTLACRETLTGKFFVYHPSLPNTLVTIYFSASIPFKKETQKQSCLVLFHPLGKQKQNRWSWSEETFFSLIRYPGIPLYHPMID